MKWKTKLTCVAFVLVLFNSGVHTQFCDVGSEDSVCSIIRTKALTSDTSVTGLGQLVVTSTGNITCNGCKITLVFPTIQINGRISASTVVISADNMTLNSGSISSSGLGYSAGAGPGVGVGYGGGSHGGGGYGSGVGNTYGSITNPTSFGSGGAVGGGAGGGFIDIRVMGTFVLDGSITADGAASYFGGGAGGSIQVQADQITCSNCISPLISASGGLSIQGGGGGGGRIVTSSRSTAPTIRVVATGGRNINGGVGGPGSVVDAATQTLLYDCGTLNGPLCAQSSIQQNSFPFTGISSLVIQNYAVVNFISVDPGSLAIVGISLTLLNNAYLFCNTSALSLTLQSLTVGLSSNLVVKYGLTVTASDISVIGVVRSNIIHIDATSVSIQLSGVLNASALGYQAQQGNGAGQASGTFYGGGGYGGNGETLSSAAGGPSYGSIATPTEFGSGGGGINGGSGGGRISVTCNTLILEGIIAANGATTNSYGAGAGGSILVNATEISCVICVPQFATISANGGIGACSYCGCGGGGRIVLQYSFMKEMISVTATGYRGGAGSVLDLKQETLSYTGNQNTNTPSVISADDIPFPAVVQRVIATNAIISLPSAFTFTGNSVVLSNSIVQCTTGCYSIFNVDKFNMDANSVVSISIQVHLIANSIYINGPIYSSTILVNANEITIDNSGVLNVTGGGYPGGQGLGVGQTESSTDGYGGGGGYGGAGQDYNNAKGGMPYGEYSNPNYFGSGGGGSNGGAGGGKIAIAASVITLEGAISANGASGGKTSTNYNSGGGSGGSIIINAVSIICQACSAHTALVTAAGGVGDGDGGGGRIYLNYSYISPSVRLLANSRNGQYGTVFYPCTEPGHTGMGGSCMPCPVGTFESSGVCTNCPAGTFTNQTEQTSCSVCPPGSYCIGGSDAIPCPIGTFQNIGGTSECTECNAGFFSGTRGQTQCEKCSPGSYSSANASSCTLCSHGYYQARSGSSSCTPCPIGQMPSSDHSKCDLKTTSIVLIVLASVAVPVIICVVCFKRKREGHVEVAAYRARTDGQGNRIASSWHAGLFYRFKLC